MAFRQGRYTEITISGVNLSAYVDSVDFSRDVEMLDTTTFTATTKTFLPGLGEGKVDIKGKYDPSANAPAQLLTQFVNATNVIPVQYFPGGNTAGQIKRYFDAYVTSYKESGAVGDIVAFEASLQVTGAITASGI
jgi:hypothetical protein